MYYMCTKFHVGITKCTILAILGAKRPDYVRPCYGKAVCYPSAQKTVIARNTKLSCGQYMLIRVKNQGCGLKGQWQGATNSANSTDCRFSTADVRLLAWADRTPLPHNHPGNRKYLSNDVRSDWKHPSEKSMDRKWMTSVDREWVS